jgi:hypothetical protein
MMLPAAVELLYEAERDDRRVTLSRLCRADVIEHEQKAAAGEVQVWRRLGASIRHAWRRSRRVKLAGVRP